ncbi:MAG: hypothetical protein WBQ09_06010 [Terriglobales bacterium]|jgi:hypothetical protein
MNKAQLDAALSTLDTFIQIFAVLVAIGIVGEVGFGVRHWVLSRRLSVIQRAEDLNQEEAIAALNKEAGDARRDAGLAMERAGEAEKNLGNARKAAAVAEQHAADANAKAEGFRLDIAKANESAAQAQAQVAGATVEAAKANLELARLRTPRSLIAIPELTAALEPFKGTEYVFTSVFQDEESMHLVEAIDSALKSAGWNRGKSVGGFPGVVFHGKDDSELSIAVGFNIGIRVSIESPQPVDDKVQLKDLPEYIRAAVALNFALPASLSPSHENNVGKKVDAKIGVSQNVRIAVGRKP